MFDWLNNNKEEENNGGFLDALNNVLDSANDEKFDYEKEQKRYRDVIVEQNLYEGDTYEDLYDELNGDE